MRSFAWLSALFLLTSLFVYKPEAAVDLGNLIPVETLWVTAEGETITVEGDQVRGVGTDWASAMADLEKTAKGTVFLETVDRVVVSRETPSCMDAIRADLCFRPAVQLYWLDGVASRELDEFTAAHESPAAIGNEEEIPEIFEEGGRYRLG